MNTWFKKSFVLSAGLALILSGCGAKSDNTATNASQTEPNAAQTADKLNVVTTFIQCMNLPSKLLETMLT